MKNTIYNFNTIAYADVAVQDFAFQKKLSAINELSESYDLNYIQFIVLADNQTFDMVSYILYDSTEYWDLLCALNERDPLFGLSISESELSNYATSMVELYEERVSEQKLDDRVKNMLFARFTQDSYDINDSNRIIKVIKIEKLKDYLKVLRDNNII